LNAGLIGCGRISARHVEAIAANSGRIKIGCVCDVRKERAQALAERLGCDWCRDLRELNGRGLDIASVLTPSGMHPQHIITLAEECDIPTIVCEKPISLDLQGARKAFERVRAAGKRLIPVYQNRFNPIVLAIKDLIDSGRLGRIYQFACNVFWNRNDEYYQIDWHGTRELDGGVLYTQASHYIDMLHFLFGQPTEYKGLSGRQRGLETDDTASTAMRFGNGTVGTLNATVSVYERNYMTEFTLIAEKGTVRVSGTNLNTIDFWNVEGTPKPNIDFKLNHQYGKGHDTLYRYLSNGEWEHFPTEEDVLSEIKLMEELSR